MRKTLLVLLPALIPLFGAGCTGSGGADAAAEPKPTAPINNAAPEAQNAQAAPRDPSIVMPGQAFSSKGKDRR